MATIASLDVALSANSANLKKDLDKATGQTKKFASSTAKQAKIAAQSFAVIGTAIAGVLTATGLIVNRAAQTGAQITNLSRNMGTSVGEFQRLAFAAKSVGIEQEKMGDIFRDVQDKIGEFTANGGGPLVDFFENVGSKIGVTIEDFQGLSGPEAMGLYVSSLEKANVSQAEMVTYMEAIASDASLLTPLFANNGAALDDLTSKYDALGIALTDIEVANLNAANVALDQMSSIASGLSTKLGAQLAPIIIDITDRFMKWAEDNPQMLKVLAGLAAVSAAVLAIGTAVVLIVPIIGGLLSPLGLVVALIAGAGAAWTIFNTGATESEQAMKDAKEANDALNTALGTFSQTSAPSAGSSAIALAQDYTKLAEAARNAAQAELDALRVRIEAAKLTQQGRRGFSGTNGLSQQERDAETALNAAQAMLDEARRKEVAVAQVITGADYTAVVAEAAAQATAAVSGASITGGNVSLGNVSGGGSAPTLPSSSTPTVNPVSDAAQSVSSSFLDSLKSGFSTALATGDWKTYKDEMLNTFSMGVIDSISNGLMNSLFDGKLFNDFFDSFGSFIQNGLSSIMSGLGSGTGFLGSIGSVLGFANGGIVPHTPYSKAGVDSVPAMLTPGELVVPVDQVANFGRGGQVVNNINITGDISRQTKKEIYQMLPEISKGVNSYNHETGGR